MYFQRNLSQKCQGGNTGLRAKIFSIYPQDREIVEHWDDIREWQPHRSISCFFSESFKLQGSTVNAHISTQFCFPERAKNTVSFERKLPGTLKVNVESVIEQVVYENMRVKVNG